MTPTPPTSTGHVWITLSDGSKVLGYWDEYTGYRRIGHVAKRDLSYMSHVPKEDISRAPMVLPLMDVDVVAWRPLGAAGEVSWEVQAQAEDGDQWLWFGSAKFLRKARNMAARLELDGQEPFATRIVQATHRVVEPEEAPATTAGEGTTDGTAH